VITHPSAFAQVLRASAASREELPQEKVRAYQPTSDQEENQISLCRVARCSDPPYDASWDRLPSAQSKRTMAAVVVFEGELLRALGEAIRPGCEALT